MLSHIKADNPNLAWWEPQLGWLTYGDIHQKALQLQQTYPSSKCLIYLPFFNRLSHVLHYIVALRLGHPLMLADPLMSHEQRQLTIDNYGVNAWIDESGMLHELTKSKTTQARLHPSLALLLPTSGSTGAFKWVRLSHKNLQSNALAIAEYLQINQDERAITSLPFFYSYGLSVLNSHLAVGAALVQSEYSTMDRQFWSLLSNLEVTSFAGVPFTYQTLNKLKFDWSSYPCLRTMTQAGGRLDSELARHFATEALKRHKRFFIMYGQTEAAPRMAWIAENEIVDHPNSIGRPIPGGEFNLKPIDGLAEGQGELIYRGPNVMMGYAESEFDLAKGAEYKELATGDVAYCDTEGRYYLCGRLKRFIKLFGKRTNLVDIETFLENKSIITACLNKDDELLIAYEPTDQDIDAVKKQLSLWLRIPINVIKFILVPVLPRTSNLKIDYNTLPQLLESSS